MDYKRESKNRAKFGENREFSAKFGNFVKIVPGLVVHDRGSISYVFQDYIDICIFGGNNLFFFGIQKIARTERTFRNFIIYLLV